MFLFGDLLLRWFPHICLKVIAGIALLPIFVIADEKFVVNRCELLPLPGQQVSFAIDGVEKTRWHFDDDVPRPFFYPFNGPSGVSLTRMGHPGAQNHDHHRSIWFAHHKLDGVDFWSDTSKSRVRQKHWCRYKDGNEEAVMASVMGWYDEDGDEVIEQELVAAIRPMTKGEHALELQLTLRCAEGKQQVVLNKTNFGLLAVRVAKSISAYFGGGTISNSEGAIGEKDIFGRQARWMDYSGPVVVGTDSARHIVYEGITYFDHPQNPRYPTYWHVRSDGWMGASFGMQEDWKILHEQPLVLRYLIQAHSGKYDALKAAGIHSEFTSRHGFVVRRPTAAEPHRQFEVERVISAHTLPPLEYQAILTKPTSQTRIH